jgi:nucleotide-binding universal stress UspA family protein
MSLNQDAPVVRATSLALAVGGAEKWTMYQKILIGYDGSSSARKAFDEALKLVRQHRAELLVVTVARPPEIGDEVETEPIVEQSRSDYRKLLEELESAAAGRTVKVFYEVAIGDPADQIICRTSAYGADLIVVGDRGRSTSTRPALGSVSRQVVDCADRSVLVVR